MILQQLQEASDREILQWPDPGTVLMVIGDHWHHLRDFNFN